MSIVHKLEELMNHMLAAIFPRETEPKVGEHGRPASW